ncbi:TorF family putative porin [Collimonas silvisoli]|uniref:TorF family putative porin n=1 Tax=Collimonas silvisoli TaxID=2825884 RepID=UPI001B8B9CD3|nr:TorF family putative porin [Collimonas silvisoli]
MKKLILAAAIATSFATNFAHAEDAKPDNEISYNIGAVNDYRYRGISQTRFDPALQGGADYTNNPTGLYAGTWLSNIKWIKDAVDSANTGTGGKGPIEWDIYGGKRGDLPGGFTYDVGGLYYYYPTNNYSQIGKNANTFELYGQLGYGPAYFKYSHAMTNLFGTVNSKNSAYYDAGANIDVGAGVTLGLHLGHQTVEHTSFASYTDWKVGVTKTFEQLAGVTLGLAYVGTDAKDGAYVSPSGKNLGRNGAVFSVAKTF